MNKKGFTLVELLAVIAILAILVIIALPNVLSMFNEAKKDTFLTEAKTIFKEVSKKYISETMKGNKITYISSEDDSKLDLNSSSNIKYCVKMDNRGVVTSMKIGNGEYYILYDGSKELSDYSQDDVINGNPDNYECISKPILLNENDLIISAGIKDITIKFSNSSDLTKLNNVKYKIFIKAEIPSEYKNEKLYKEIESDNKSNNFEVIVDNPIETYVGQDATYRVEVYVNNNSILSIDKISKEYFCFVAGTKVKTENGFKNIEDIKLGEKVYSYNFNTNELELKKVTKLINSEANETYKMDIGGEIIEMSMRHELYIIDKGWTRAYDVEVGDKMISSDDKIVTIKKIDLIKYDLPIKTYNLTVEGNNNYFVTYSKVLVHNSPAV